MGSYVYRTVEKTVQKMVSLRAQGKTIGLVPTMGALHQGHLSLIKNAKATDDIVVVSIFVNPTQFDRQEDMDNYPSDIQRDVKTLQGSGCDILFVPAVSDIYEEGPRRESFDFDGVETLMEGKYRPGHFDGVATVVKRLFEIVKPHDAYFGEKDYQQLCIVRKLTEKHRIPVKINSCPTYREKDGLAMSSRNERLTKEQRKAAGFIYSTLMGVKAYFGVKSIAWIYEWVAAEFKNHPILRLEYFEIADSRTLGRFTSDKKNVTYRAFMAVFAGDIRLIDNIAVN